MGIYQRKSIRDAIILAEELKNNGKYDLFRGQVNDWPIVSTMFRAIDNHEDEIGNKKLDELYSYFKSIPELQQYTQIDSFDAIAQHYGLPTYLIDFTTEPKVAGYFATSTNNKRDLRKDGVIICINSQEIKNRTELLCRYNSDFPIESFPYIVSPDITCLWRLQSQKGCFLSNGMKDWEMNYPITKIYFSHDDDYTVMSEDEIYPKRKSSLEIILDNFFSEYNRRLRLEDMKKSIHFDYIYALNLKPQDYCIKFEPHSSWNVNEINNWISPKENEWKGTDKIRNITLYYDLDKDFSLNFHSIKADLLSIMNRNNIRNHYLSFNINLGCESKKMKEKGKLLSTNCSKLWDGTNNFPYKNKQIAYMIAKYICLEMNYSRPYPTFNELFKIYEFGSTHGYPNTSRCSYIKIKKSYRKDLRKMLKPVYYKYRPLQLINTPNYIFDFWEFKQVFIKYLLPWQMFLCSTKDQSAIYYSPANLDLFGFK